MRQLKANVEEDSAEAIMSWCTDHGITFSALTQALGDAIREEGFSPQKAVVERARQIAGDRRRRSNG